MAKTALRELHSPIVPFADDGADDDAVLLHNSVYDELSWRMITGRIIPGVPLSTRGLAQELGVSQMPGARGAVPLGGGTRHRFAPSGESSCRR